MILGRNEFAGFFGVSRGLVTKWLHAGMPAERGAKPWSRVEIETTKAVPWIIDYCQRERQQTPTRDRLTRAQAERIEAENTARRAELVPREAVAWILGELSDVTVSAMDAVP